MRQLQVRNQIWNKDVCILLRLFKHFSFSFISSVVDEPTVIESLKAVKRLASENIQQI